MEDDQRHEREGEGDVPAERRQRPDVAGACRVGQPETEQPDRAQHARKRPAHLRPPPQQAAPDDAELRPDERDHGHAGGAVRPHHQARVALAHPQADAARRERRRERRPQNHQVDTPPHVFRQNFFDYMGRKLAWKFTAHPTNQHHWAE